MKTGNIGVTTENIFPIIKKFLYSDHEIFLRELVSNAVDASQKLNTLARVGEFDGEVGALNVTVSIDKEAGTLTISDRGVGMTEEEIEKYINQIAFSGAEEFLEKYKNDTNAIIGHFGLGFYSSFMVSKKVEIRTLSYRQGAQAMQWSCDGSPLFEMEPIEKATRGTDIILYIDDENKDFLEHSRIEGLLKKYCRFLPIPVVFGKEQEWKEGKQVDTEQDKVINETTPLWTRKPTELTDEEYKNFYYELYPMGDEPLFWIHLNVDYPFNLTGILYFPKVKNNFDIQRNKIQLYCNQVFVTDSVEGVVPEFLTLLQGVIDSPDIPLNVSRSYLQSDSNVKKISTYITKKVSERLQEIFNADRKQFEEKWDDVKIFIEYGMLSDEKFCERALKFSLLKNENNQYFTTEEYRTLIEGNQTDKNGQLICLYTTDKQAQFGYIEIAKERGYDVLVMDGQLDTHFVGLLEQKMEKCRFVRVDSNVIDKLIEKDEHKKASLTAEQMNMMSTLFKSQIPPIDKCDFMVMFEPMGVNAQPVLITQNEFMRRMKAMSGAQPGMNFYGEMPDSYNLIVNTDHPLANKIIADAEATCANEATPIATELSALDTQLKAAEEAVKEKKEEEKTAEEKEVITSLRTQIEGVKARQAALFTQYAGNNRLLQQLVDLALLSNNMLRGESLARFVRRSVELL